MTDRHTTKEVEVVYVCVCVVLVSFFCVFVCFCVEESVEKVYGELTVKETNKKKGEETKTKNEKKTVVFFLYYQYLHVFA